jgi:hypothetical protein
MAALPLLLAGCLRSGKDSLETVAKANRKYCARWNRYYCFLTLSGVKIATRTALYRLTSSDALNVPELRQRLRNMTDTELLRFGQAAKYMCSPEASFGHAPRRTYVVQLQEARAEWKRRKPEMPVTDSI